MYGKIYIRTEIPLDAKFLEIKVKGKEKASFWREESYEHDGERRTRHIKEKYYYLIKDKK